MFGLSAVFIVYQWEDVQPVDLLLLLGASSAWAACWLFPQATKRSTIAPLVPFAFLISVLLSPSAILWPPIATLAFASVIVSICLWFTPFSVASILIAALVTLIGSKTGEPTTLLVSTDFLGGYATTLVALTLPTAILVVTAMGKQIAKAADNATDNALKVQAQRLHNHARREAQASTARRIHETYLNALVSLTDMNVNEEQARAMCSELITPVTTRHDSELRNVGAILASFIETYSLTTVLPQHLRNVEFANSEVSRAFRDSLNETLINAHRHAGGCTALNVTVRENHLAVEVSDNGPGNPELWRNGFGITHNVNGALDRYGGCASYVNRPQGGTTVTITIDLNAQPNRPPSLPQWNVFVDTPLIRLALLPTLFVGAIFVPIAATSLLYSVPTIALYFIFFAALVALVFTPRHCHSLRLALAVLSLALGIATLVVSALGQPTCASAVPMHWVIYSVAGSSLLPIFTLPNRITQLAAFFLWFSVALGVGSQWPTSCAIETLGASMEAVIWNALILTLFLLVQRQFVTQRELVLNEWHTDMSMSSSRESSNVELRHLTFANTLCYPLFSSIAQARVRPGEPECQTQAAVINSLARTYLSLVAEAHDPETVMQVERIIHALSERSVGVEVTIAHRDANADDFMPVVLDILCALATHASGESNEILILESFLLLTGPSQVVMRVCEGYVIDPKRYVVFPHADYGVCTAEIALHISEAQAMPSQS